MKEIGTTLHPEVMSSYLRENYSRFPSQKSPICLIFICRLVLLKIQRNDQGLRHQPSGLLKKRKKDENGQGNRRLLKASRIRS